MDLLEAILDRFNDYLWGYILIAVLIGLGILFTVKTRFVQFRYIAEMFRILVDKRTLRTKGKGISAFQAFTISTASRVGTGNLAGVASAVAAGGPGAVFWMWLIALLGGATSFVESTLAQVYKEPVGNQYRGGPAYYIEKGMKKRGLGIAFAIIITFTYGLVYNSVQSNTIRLALEESFGLNPYIMAIILFVLTAVVIFGGVLSIARVTQFVIPIMALLYVLFALYIVILNIAEIPSVIQLIFLNAFGIREIAGGGFGAAIMMGIKRGLFSNEAGMGSAPNAAATAEVTHPVKQGLIQTLGVFVDTLIICSATALIILTTEGYAGSALQGIQITQNAFSQHIGKWASVFVSVAIFLFAYSSILGNYYYGETNIEFIKESKTALTFYRIAVLVMVVFGTLQEFDLVWKMADFSMAIMALVNLFAITVLSGIAYRVLTDYKEQRKQGKDPQFHREKFQDVPGITYWAKEQLREKQD